MNNIFNLERSIAEWRRRMLAAGIKTPVPMEELENHLREVIEQGAKSGLNEEETFTAAVQQIGQAHELRSEFTKVSGTILERIKQFILTLIGIPASQPATTMNTSNSNPNIEPRWATYLKATTSLMPAAFVWLFSVIFMLPKLNEICQSAGFTVFDLSGAPAIYRNSATIVQVMVFLTAHGILVSGAVVLAFVLLEWRSKGWPRYRRTTIGVGIFLFNFAVLISITLMVLSALIAAPALLHHVK